MGDPTISGGGAAAAAAAAELKRLQAAEAKRAADAQARAAELRHHTGEQDIKPEYTDNTKTIDKDTFVKEAKIDGTTEADRAQLYDKFNKDGEDGLTDDEFNAAFAGATEDGAGAGGADAGTLTVKPGDTLSGIAGDKTGDQNKWKELYEANKDVIGPDPNKIQPGMQLKVPESWQPKPPADQPPTDAPPTDAPPTDPASPPGGHQAPDPNAPPTGAGAPSAQDVQNDVNKAMKNPPKPGDTLDKDGNVDATKAAGLQKQGDDLQTEVDKLPAGPEKDTMQQQVDAYKQNVSDVLSKEGDVSAKTKAFNDSLKADPLSRNDVCKAFGDLQKACGNDVTSPALKAAGAKLMDDDGPVKKNTDGDESDWAVQLLNNKVDMNAFSVDDRLTMLKDCTQTHDDDVHDDKNGPAEATQALVKSLSEDPDPGAMPKLAQMYKDVDGDAKNRLNYFLTAKDGNENQLYQLPKEVVEDMAKHVQTDHDCRKHAQAALDDWDAHHQPPTDPASPPGGHEAPDPGTPPVPAGGRTPRAE